jgi:hypothetical protein
MPAALTDTKLCEPLVPAAWAGVLVQVQAFQELERRLSAADGAVSSADQQELDRLHEGIVRESAALLEPAVLEDLAEEELARIFGRSVLFLMRLKECVLDEAGVLDTAGSRTLPLYEADFFHTPANVTALEARLAERFSLGPSLLKALKAEVERDLGDCRAKQALVRALCDEFGLRSGAADLRKSALALFRALYPQAPVAAEEVDVVATGTMLFFCLPLDEAKTTLTTPRFAALSPREQAPLLSFLADMRRFTQERFAHFPAFGYVDGGRIEPVLIRALARRSGLGDADVLRALPGLVTILPVTEIEKFLVHDVWGHGWQASMLRFDDLYAEIARFAVPLDLGEAASASPAGGLSFAECFTGQGTSLELDADLFRQFVHGEVCERLPVALSAVLAEIMADVAEFKFLAENPQARGRLPTSSRLPLFPAKLDLTFQDIPFYFSQATKVFRNWAKQPAQRERTIAQLVARGASPDAAGRAVALATEIWNEMAAGFYAPVLAWRPIAGDKLEVNAYTRVVLNFVGLHRAVLQTYTDVGELDPGGLPLKSFRDLLVLGASVFFESDPARNLWRMDEFLSLKLVPFCRRLAERWS